ncbi:MAG TPA: aldose 1-epimerase family protein [Edaphobacter sp.]|nr:aldose 1-epimerase family protein [Edaphobacter sp.]
MQMWPRNFSPEMMSHVGRLSQVGGISPFTHAEGKAKGTSTLRVRTAKGLEFWVVPDKGLDIYEASFQGRSLCWHSPTGMVHPAYYSSRGLEWLKGFSGGLLTTCGLSTAGAPSRDQGEDLGLHGSISNTPAENVCWSESWEQGDCIFRISGSVRETSVHGPNLVLQRTITSSLNSAFLKIHDVVENQGVRPTPLMVIYHFNFGFPLLTPRSRIHAPSRQVTPIDDFSRSSVEEWDRFGDPRLGLGEKVYFHEMATSKDNVTVVLVSDEEDPAYGIAMTYDPRTLPKFNQWKMTSANHYVLGLEPGNCNTRGREYERSQGTLEFMEPGERKEFSVELRVLEDEASVKEAIRSASAGL